MAKLTRQQQREERFKFEEWFLKRYAGYDRLLFIFEIEKYNYERAQMCWESWLARAEKGK